MTNLVSAYQNDDITEFEKILRTNRLGEFLVTVRPVFIAFWHLLTIMHCVFGICVKFGHAHVNKQFAIKTGPTPLYMHVFYHLRCIHASPLTQTKY